MDATPYVTRGNGAAIHIASINGLWALVTLCDGWSTGNALGGRNKGKVRAASNAEAATCKRCIKINDDKPTI